mmetsp:Transcript_29545/g.74159  ORF Transcript_29545/g.74159 Transcript_29545/m.74159 type:complete len:380 (-) Transcript_29545:664-1803(-)
MLVSIESAHSQVSKGIFELPQEVVKPRLGRRISPELLDGHIKHRAPIYLAWVFEAPYCLQRPHDRRHVLNVVYHRLAVLLGVATAGCLLPKAALRVWQGDSAAPICAETGTRIPHRLLVPCAHLPPEKARPVLLARPVPVAGAPCARFGLAAALPWRDRRIGLRQRGTDGIVLAGLKEILRVGVEQARIVCSIILDTKPAKRRGQVAEEVARALGCVRCPVEQCLELGERGCACGTVLEPRGAGGHEALGDRGRACPQVGDDLLICQHAQRSILEVLRLLAQKVLDLVQCDGQILQAVAADRLRLLLCALRRHAGTLGQGARQRCVLLVNILQEQCRPFGHPWPVRIFCVGGGLQQAVPDAVALQDGRVAHGQRVGAGG